MLRYRLDPWRTSCLTRPRRCQLQGHWTHATSRPAVPKSIARRPLSLDCLSGAPGA